MIDIYRRTGYLSGVQKQPPQMFFRIVVFKNFAKFTGKHLPWSLFFNKVAGFKNTFFMKHLQWLLLGVVKNPEKVSDRIQVI